MTNIESLVNELTEYNKAYRTGNTLISDIEYDSLLEQLRELDENNPFFDKIGIEIVDEGRKRKLPIQMASMDKIKKVDELLKWCKSKNFSIKEKVVLTPKYDGLSFCVDETNNQGTTRGDGEIGQSADQHYELIGNHLNIDNFKITYGEIMMSKDKFNSEYAIPNKYKEEGFANARNLVSGLLNNKEATEPLKDLSYIKYGGILINENKINKHEILDLLNKGQEIKVPYEIFSISELTEEILVNLYKKWSIDYEIDGIIIEIDNISIQKDLGRERNGNPSYARAFKSELFEEVGETTILKISNHISKQGLIKPVGNVAPVKIGGVIISNVTLNNYKYVLDNNIGAGSKVLLSRSGGVIPKIIKVIEATGFSMPEIDDIKWGPNNVDLICVNVTKEQEIKRIIAFFEILGVEQVGSGIFENLYNLGFTTIKDILNLTIKDLEKLEGFGNRKATIVYENIQSKIKNVELNKFQHASSCFSGLGSKKLVLLEHFYYKNPSIQDIISIDGFAETSAIAYLNAIDEFKKFAENLPMITIRATEKKISTSNDLEGRVYVFTGVRDLKAEDEIIKRSGKIGSSVNGKSTHLIIKKHGSNSSKELKAIELGLNILTLDELWNELDN